MPKKKVENNNVNPCESGEMNSSNAVRTALIDGVNFYSKSIQYAVVDGLAIFEGDIVLGMVAEVERDTEIRRKEMRGEIARGVVITGAQFRWPNCTIPYTIDPNLPNQVRVTDAIAHWEANTNFRFVLRTAANANQFPDWVTFRPSSGCSSSVGRRGGQQFINLGSGCTTGSTIHEIGHTVGLWHEQSREDRDTFVIINWAKIQPGMEHNFNQHITDGDDVGGYDYGSIMHYPRTAFSIDGTDTITPTDSSAVIGQRNGLSAGDIAAANSLCLPRPICPPAPGPICPPAPFIKCPPAPLYCPPAPFIKCPPAPLYCPPAPFYCPPAPNRCIPAPVGCLAGPYMHGYEMGGGMGQDYQYYGPEMWGGMGQGYPCSDYYPYSSGYTPESWTGMEYFPAGSTQGQYYSSPYGGFPQQGSFDPRYSKIK